MTSGRQHNWIQSNIQAILFSSGRIQEGQTAMLDEIWKFLAYMQDNRIQHQRNLDCSQQSL